jgi:signal transduction histidine kinase
MTGSSYGVENADRVTATSSPPAMKPIWVSDAALTIVLVVLISLSPQEGSFVLQSAWPDFLFWSVLVATVNLLPIRVHELYLTLDAPVILAVAVLYDPLFAALVAFVATVDSRELRLQMKLSYAVFNRLQTSITAFLASAAFHLIAPELDSWPQTAVGMLVALLIDYVLNVAFVLGAYVERGGHLRPALGHLRIGQPLLFFGTYLGYGLLALVLGRLFEEVGAWSVLTFLVPILVARQMLMRTQRLETLAEDLRSRERLLERLFDRAIDDRRDERSRIASELHDGVLQSLTKIWMTASVLRKGEFDSPTERQDVEELAVVANNAIQDLRRLMKEIRESPLGRKGLLPTLESLVRDLRLDWQRHIVLRTPGQLDLPPTVQVTAYQVAREGLINALKHSEASSICVTVAEPDADDRVEIIVEDNGKGFDVDEGRSPIHFGLGLLEERVRMLGGRFTVVSRPGQGTRLGATLPTRSVETAAPRRETVPLD